ncbi:MAG: outer membrane beta-barrel protein, partial [Bacteriovoracaceae bacterium]|nr:outer membrane beta-barrel protein [Bacteriovoracaceae bacterium]
RLNHALEAYPGPEGAVLPHGPVAPVPGTVPGQPSFFHRLRYSVYYGYMKFNSNWYDFNSKFRWGLTAEGNLNPNIAMGLYFNYVSVEDLAMDMGWSPYSPGGQQKFDQTMWSFGLFAKYYFQNWNSVRPYVYGGLGYNNITTRYSEVVVNAWKQIFTKSEYSSSSFSGQLAGGLLLDFSPNFGMFVQLGAAFNFASSQPAYSYSEAEERSKAIEDATAFDITVGASFKF